MKIIKLTIFALFSLATISISSMASATIIGTAALGTGNCIPFGCVSGEYQQVYGASEFTGTVNISSLTFYNTEFDSGDYTSNTGNYVVSLTTTSKSVDGLSTTASDNYGVDMMQVFSGSIATNHGFGGSFDIIFDNIFTYDSSLGNLLMVVTASGIGNVSNTFYDVDNGNSNTTSRYASGGTDTLGLVTGFNVASVVQASTPASAMLFLIACVGLFIRRK